MRITSRFHSRSGPCTWRRRRRDNFNPFAGECLCGGAIALQIEYSLNERTVERDLMPMARELDIAVTPWSPLAGELLTGKHNPVDRKARAGKREMNERRMEVRNLKISEAVQWITGTVGRSPAQVALNWLMQKPGVTSLIVGARTLEQLEDNLRCLDFILLPEHMAALDSVSDIDLGFPHRFLATDVVRNYISGEANIEDRQEP